MMHWSLPSRAQLHHLKNPNEYAVFITAVFLVVGSTTAWHHEMWRDEIQAWLVVRDSASFTELFRNIKYQGHPGLWYFLLWIASRIASSPHIMQLLHLLIGATTIYLFVRYSPFTRIHKFLFSFGYFAVYEYSIICRNYAPGVLLVCVLCALFRQRYAKFIWIATVLFLLSHTSVHALIIAIAVGLGLLLEYLFHRRDILSDSAAREWHIISGFAVIAIGLITAVLQITPPADSGVVAGWVTHYNEWRLAAVLKLVAQAFLPLPQVDIHFWDSQRLHALRNFQPALACLLLVCASVVLLRKPAAFFIYVIGSAGLLGFFYVKHIGGIRHHGFLFILFMMVVWMYPYCHPIRGVPLINRIALAWKKSWRPAITMLLFVHFVSGVIAVGMDYRHVFSYGKAAADFIKEQNMQDMLIVGERDSRVSTIVGYLGKDRVYYPRGNRFGSFVIWDQARTDVSDEEVLQKANELALKRREDVLIILSHKLRSGLTFANNPTELARFTGSIVQSEAFYLYLLRHEAERESDSEKPLDREHNTALQYRWEVHPSLVTQ